ncbi:MAG: hypothetical protein Q7R35_05875 [Elusimicrobiota bacterium]|nr:hypothetical protein [Elusimicrobiota bacterium]
MLTALGFMRELGEGVPRMFDEMERAGYYPPRFEAIGGGVVQVTLRNEPVYNREMLECQEVVKTDIYGASNVIKDMIRKGVVRSLGKGSRIYEVKEPLLMRPDMPPELAQLLSVLQRKGRLTNADIRGTLGLSKISAVRLLRELVVSHWLTGTGKRGVGAIYSPGPRLLYQSQTITKEAKAIFTIMLHWIIL